MKKASPKTRLPAHQKNLPVTVGVLFEVRNELKADIRSANHRFDSMEHKFEARFESMESKLSSMESSIHRVQALVEHQNSENRIMYEALTGFLSQLNEVKSKQGEHDGLIRGLVSIKSK